MKFFNKAIILLIVCIFYAQNCAAYNALSAQQYEQCWQNLFKNSSMCPVISDCMQNGGCAASLHKDYVCSINCNKLNFTGPGNLTSQASDPNCGHSCDLQYAPSNYSSHALYWSVIDCYSQCYDILELPQPTYTSGDAQSYEQCWGKLFSNQTTCVALKNCMGNSLCRKALNADYECSIDCNKISYQGFEASDPLCGHSCDKESAPKDKIALNYWNQVMQCYDECYSYLASTSSVNSK